MPTVRFDAVAIQAIKTLAAIASDDVCVHIGDNSLNPEKHALLHALAASRKNVRVTCHSTDLGAEANWLDLVRAQSAPFVCMAADDDSFSEAYFATALTIISNDQYCGAACGLQISVANDGQSSVPTFYSPSERLENSPLERIINYSNQNSIAYAVTRTKFVQYFADYVESNPLKCAFNDYLLAFHVLSVDTFRVDRSGLAYVYNNDNWHQFTGARRARGKFYMRCGLPAEFGLIERAHWAVANAHFFSSRYRAPGLSNSTARSIAVTLFNRMIKEFRLELNANKSIFYEFLKDHKHAHDALRELSNNKRKKINEVLDLFVKIIEAFSQDLAERYHSFIFQSLVESVKNDPFEILPEKWRPWV